LVWLCLKVIAYVLTKSLSMKSDEKAFVYKCKLILHNLISFHLFAFKPKLNGIFFSEWFQIQTEFKTPFEEMSPKEINKCLQMFYLSARK